MIIIIGQQQQSSSVSAAPTMYHQGMATPGIPPPSPSPFIPPPLPQPYPHLPQQFPHNAGMMSHPPHPVPPSPYPHNNPMLFMMPHQAQHQTLHPPPHPHLMQQHPGLLPPHMMHHPLHFPRPPMQPQMMAPPPNIRAPPPAGWTPALTTVSSSQNPVAVVPLTVYIGRIPPELDDEMIKKVFGVFGKILRWNRPMDSSQTIKVYIRHELYFYI